MLRITKDTKYYGIDNIEKIITEMKSPTGFTIGDVWGFYTENIDEKIVTDIVENFDNVCEEITDCTDMNLLNDVVVRHTIMNPLNTVHGGVFFTLADTICGIAAASSGYGGPTVQGDMDYMRAVRGKEIVCTARVVKTGKTLTWVDGIITDDTDREVARTKFIYYRLKEARHFGFESRD